MIIQQNTHEFVVDFLSTVVSPRQIATRVIMNPAAFANAIQRIEADVLRYEQEFGLLHGRRRNAESTVTVELYDSPTACVGPVPRACGNARSEDDEMVGGEAVENGGDLDLTSLYRDFKYSNQLIAGKFASDVQVRHLAEEFCLDFIFGAYRAR